MNRLPRILSVACLSLSLTAPAAWAGSTAIVEQTGNYELTIVQQTGNKTRVVNREIKPANHARLTARFTKQTARAAAIQTLYSASGVTNACLSNKGAYRSTSKLNGMVNGAAISPYGAAGSLGGSNTASVVQAGSNNTATASQSGSNNAAFVIQAGDNHTAQTTQTGNYNIAMVKQGC